MEFSNEVNAAIIYGLGTAIGGSFVFVAAIWTYYKTKKKLIHPLMTSNILISFKTLTGIMLVVTRIFKRTSADRFLLLFAHNGSSMLRFANVALEQHAEGKHADAMLSLGASNRYVLFEFDDEYRKMLKQVELEGRIELETKKMTNCDLRNIYESERVKHSKIYFLHRIRNYDGKKNDLVLYCSLAKHGDGPFTEKEKWFMRHEVINIQRSLKPLISKYEIEPPIQQP